MVRAILAIGLVGAALSLGACQQLEEAFDRVSGEGSPDIPTSVDLLVLEFMDQNGYPGATVSVTKGSQLVWSKGYGYANAADRTQMEPWHRTWVGSTAKLITAVVAMRLVEEGRFDLDDPIYASSAKPLWGADGGMPPGVVASGDGLLADGPDYLSSMVEGVGHLNELFPPSEHTEQIPSLNWWQLLLGSYQEQITTVLDRASRITVRHLLSHSSGIVGSGDGAVAAEEFGKLQTEITYPEVHHTKLRGRHGEFLNADSGMVRSYSNHGFGLLGHLIAEQTGTTYIAATEKRVLDRLGLHHVVPVRTALSQRDAHRHDHTADPPTPWAHDEEDPAYEGPIPSISVATGGWAATAQDLVRVACALDHGSNNLRVIGFEAVDELATVAFPQAQGGSDQPLGWDSRSGDTLRKNGRTGRGGTALVQKFLPGSLGDEEINVAIAFNMYGPNPWDLLPEIAKIVADAEVAEDYDLFDPAYRCYAPPPRRKQPPPRREQPTPSPGGSPTTTPSPTGTPGSTPTPTTAPTPSGSPGVATAPPGARETPTPRPRVSPSPPPRRPPTSPPTRTPTALRVDDVVVRPGQIWESAREMNCGPTTSDTTVRVSGAASRTVVDLRWSVGETSGSVRMDRRGDGLWSATIGPFRAGTLSRDRPSSPIDLTVVASDPDGRRSTAQAAIPIRTCPPVPQ
jgi:CubicO group peptidase (beta-lactamase class C family)